MDSMRIKQRERCCMLFDFEISHSYDSPQVQMILREPKLHSFPYRVTKDWRQIMGHRLDSSILLLLWAHSLHFRWISVLIFAPSRYRVILASLFRDTNTATTYESEIKTRISRDRRGADDQQKVSAWTWKFCSQMRRLFWSMAGN